MVAIVGFNALIPFEEVGEDGIKKLDVRPCAIGVGTLDPDKVPPWMLG